MPLVISALVFALVFIISSALMRPRGAATKARLDDLLSSSGRSRDDVQHVTGSFGGRVVAPAFVRLGNWIMSVTPRRFLEKTRAKLDLAGNPTNFGMIEYFVAKAVSVMVLLPLGLLGLHYVPLAGLPRLVAIAVVVGMGWWLPDILLQRLIETRQVAIRRALPDVLDLLLISVGAGVSFDGAMQKVVEKSHGPLQAELARVLEQVRLGKSRGEALREMAQRTQVAELTGFVSAIVQAETMGISIVPVLHAQATVVRERRSQLAREAAAILPTKLLFPLVFFIFPSLFVVILGPAVIRILEVFLQME